jgi:hypothetical protein
MNISLSTHQYGFSSVFYMPEEEKRLKLRMIFKPNFVFVVWKRPTSLSTNDLTSGGIIYHIWQKINVFILYILLCNLDCC